MVIRVLHQSPAPTLTFHLLLSPPVTSRQIEESRGEGNREGVLERRMKDSMIRGHKSDERGKSEREGEIHTNENANKTERKAE